MAIAVLVFSRTSSALLTSLAYALTFLPPLVSAPLLTGLADRYPRRTVLVVTDLCRASLVAVMAIPAVPLAALVPLLVAMVSIQPLYSASRNAMLPNVLEGDAYPVGLGLADVTDGIAQVSGFALGGVLTQGVGSHAALGVDAGTFVVSVLLVRFGVRLHRPAAEPERLAAGTRRSFLRGFTLLWGNPRLRAIALLYWVYGFYVAPEGVAAPYAHQLGSQSFVVGLLMAADPVGAAFGAVAVSRWLRPADRARAIGPLAVLTGVPLTLSALHPSVPLALSMWVITGALAAYTIPAIAEFARSVPDNRRGQSVGLLGAGLQASQGLGILLAGALSGPFPPSVSVALCGAGGVACALGPALARKRQHAAGTG